MKPIAIFLLMATAAIPTLAVPVDQPSTAEPVIISPTAKVMNSTGLALSSTALSRPSTGPSLDTLSRATSTPALTLSARTSSSAASSRSNSTAKPTPNKSRFSVSRLSSRPAFRAFQNSTALSTRAAPTMPTGTAIGSGNAKISKPAVSIKGAPNVPVTPAGSSPSSSANPSKLVTSSNGTPVVSSPRGSAPRPFSTSSTSAVQSGPGKSNITIPENSNKSSKSDSGSKNGTANANEMKAAVKNENLAISNDPTTKSATPATASTLKFSRGTPLGTPSAAHGSSSNTQSSAKGFSDAGKPSSTQKLISGATPAPMQKASTASSLQKLNPSIVLASRKPLLTASVSTGKPPGKATFSYQILPVTANAAGTKAASPTLNRTVNPSNTKAASPTLNPSNSKATSSALNPTVRPSSTKAAISTAFPTGSPDSSTIAKPASASTKSTTAAANPFANYCTQRNSIRAQIAHLQAENIAIPPYLAGLAAGYDALDASTHQTTMDQIQSLQNSNISVAPYLAGFSNAVDDTTGINC